MLRTHVVEMITAAVVVKVPLIVLMTSLVEKDVEDPVREVVIGTETVLVPVTESENEVETGKDEVSVMERILVKLGMIPLADVVDADAVAETDPLDWQAGLRRLPIRPQSIDEDDALGEGVAESVPDANVAGVVEAAGAEVADAAALDEADALV